MRKHFFATEAAPQGVAPPIEVPPICVPLLYRQVSLEEEAVITDEAATDAAEIEKDLTESNRVLEVSDALEDVAVVADRIEEASPEEVALIDSATQMAVAGTDVPPEQMVPAMESYVGKKISTESLRETAKKIWDNIQAFLKRIWDRIVAYFRVAVIVPQLEQRLEAMLKRVDDLGDEAREGTKSVKIRHASLAVEGKMVKSLGDVQAALRNLEEAATYVFNDNPKEVNARGEAIAQIIEGFTAEKAAETVQALRDKLEALPQKPVNGSKGPTTQGDFEVFSGKPLLGGGALLNRVFKKNGDASPLGALDHFRKSGVVFDADFGARRAEEGVEFPVLNKREMEALLSDTKKLLETLKDFDRTELQELKKTGDKLRAASVKATAEISKIAQDDKGQASVVNDYRACLNFNAAFAGWVQNPAIPFYGKVISAVKALMYLVSESAAAYDSKAAAVSAAANTPPATA